MIDDLLTVIANDDIARTVVGDLNNFVGVMIGLLFARAGVLVAKKLIVRQPPEDSRLVGHPVFGANRPQAFAIGDLLADVISKLVGI